MISKTHYFSLFIALLLVLSCSDDDNNTDTIPDNSSISGDYFPTNLDSYWNYDVEASSTAATEPSLSTDALAVETMNNNDFTLSANAGLPANGTMSGILVSGTLTNTDTTLSLNGSLDLPEELTDLIDFNITLNNAILYNINASSNTLLYSLNEQVTQDVQGFPVGIDYEVKSKSLGFYNTISLNNEEYTNVVASEIILNLSATTSVDFGGFPITITILEPQDLLVITSYYAENIGLVRAESNFDYEISATAIAALANSGIDLGIPASGSANNVQELTAYGPQ